MRRNILIGASCVAIFIALLTIILGIIGDATHYPYRILSDGWRLRGELTDAGGDSVPLEDDSVNVTTLPVTKRGDYLQVSVELPDMGDIPFPTLMFETRYAAYEVSVNGVVVDRFAIDRYHNRRFVGSTYHLVSLPEDYAGEYVSITLYRTESHAGRVMSAPYIGAHEDLEAMLVRWNFFSLGCGFFLVIFGMSFVFLTLIYLGNVPELKPQLHGSILCAVLGILLITNDHAAFLVMNADVGATINYLSIYSLLPLSIILNNSLNTEHIIPDKIYRQLLPLTTAFFIVVVLLHVTGIAHMNRALFPYYLLAAVGVAIQMPDLIRNLTVKTNPAASRVTMMGLAAVIVCLTVSMIVIFAWRMGLPYVDRETGHNLLPLGAMLFACSQVVNYLSFISESGSRQKDYASLQNIAYADALTGLANRARADKVFEDLDRSREDYCLVSVDVNGLKDTNDRLGHAAGDQLLRDYATALKANFGDEELCARMGGDEFLVVMKRTNADGFGVRLRRLYSDLDEMNAKDKTIFRSAAIGYAFRHECHGGNAHAVYLLADERMFENKREQHIRYRIKDRN